VQDRSGRMPTSAANGSYSCRGRQLRPDEPRRFNPGPLYFFTYVNLYFHL
jgi:hypothetical protein